MVTTRLATIACATLLGLSQQSLAGSGAPIAEVATSANTCQTSGPSCQRVADELWLVSCHGLPSPSCCRQQPTDAAGEGLTYWRYDHQQCRWRRADLDALQATDALQLPTVFWVHGARTSWSASFQYGWRFYRELVRGRHPEMPMRMIIWSWPATQDYRLPVRDLRDEATRTDPAGWRLAWLLNQLDADQTIGLAGYSLGSRVIFGALNLLGGGQLLGQTLDVPAEISPRRYRAVFMAAAVPNCALQPGQDYGRALSHLDSLLLLNNYCDWVLKRYGRLYCLRYRRGPQALGYTGMAFTSSMAPYQDRVRQFNAGVYIGSEHRWPAYVYSPALMSMIRKHVLLAPQDHGE